VTPWLPAPHNLVEAAGVALAVVLFVVLGAVWPARRALPETALVAGWGLACLVLTLWGVLTTASLRGALTFLVVVAIANLLRAGRADRIGPLAGAGRVLLLSLPVWLVMLPARPSQIDTWLNLLPNAGYLFHYDLLPTALRPASYSFLPVAPYNTQFAAYVASVATGGFADSAMALFNIALQCAAAMLLARAVAGREEPLQWWACAVGLLLAVPLNPGFVPRVFFSSYGEAPLAVTTLFAVWLAVELIEDLANRVRWPRAMVPLALVLIALINTKQSGIGQVLPLGATLLVLAICHPRVARGRAAGAVVLAVAPSLALYGIWQVFAARAFVAGQLEPLPLAAWHFGLLPRILLSMLREIVEKATFYICLAVVLGGFVWSFRRARWSRETLLLGMIAGVAVGFNGFLVVSYLGHFDRVMAAQAHSYFRYSSQLSLLVMLGLVVLFRPVAARWLDGAGRRARHAGAGAIALILILPPVLAPMLRFDLAPPQPTLWDLGRAAAQYVAPGDRLAVLVPGDTDDSVGSMLRGLLLFTPRTPATLDLRTETKANPATLQALSATGFHLALVTCTPADLPGVPPGVAAMLRYRNGDWQVLKTWSYAPDLAHRRFAALLARAPLCAAHP
jgi:hypothetical protein